MKALLLTATAVSLFAGVATYQPSLLRSPGAEQAAGDVVPASPDVVLARLMNMRTMTALAEFSRRPNRAELDYLVTETVSESAANEAELDVSLGDEHVLTVRAKVTPAGPERSRVAVEARLIPSRLTMSPHLARGDIAHFEAILTTVARAYIVRTFEPAVSDKEREQRFESAIGLPRLERKRLFERFGEALLTSYQNEIQAAEQRAEMDGQRAYERSRGLAAGTAPPAWQAEEAAARAEEDARLP
jgi:hypothetical protein